MPTKEGYWAKRAYYLSKAKEYRTKYPERMAATRYLHTVQVRDYLRSMKEQVPCADCGQYFPHYVMEFDHVNGNRTRRGRNNNGCISSLLSQRWSVVLSELAKCEVVCANCHRKRTWSKLYASGDWGDDITKGGRNKRYRVEVCSCYGTDDQKTCVICGGLGIVAYIKTEDGKEVLGHTTQRHNQPKEVCPHGHSYTPDNIIISHGYRQCRECKRESDKRTYLRRKAKR